MIDIRYMDRALVVCVKPAGVRSTDEPGGLPSLLREQLGLGKALRTVHRLDQVVSGLMVLARGQAVAAHLSGQMAARTFEKEYLAVLHGCPPQPSGTLTDLLGRDRARRMTYVAQAPGRDAREAVLDYRVLAQGEGTSLVRVTLHTGRTHQIRVQFASRGLPLVGERKYFQGEDGCPLALFSSRLAFAHPDDGRPMEFVAEPPALPPWTAFPGKFDLSFPPGEDMIEV